MAKGVAASFIENFKKIYDIINEVTYPLQKINIPDDIIKIGNEELKESYPLVYRKAYEQTVKDTHEAMAAFIYNINSMHSRGHKI